jgi:hypothetical protein
MRAALTLGLAVALAGCDDEPRPEMPSAFDTAAPPSFSAARRPAETIYIERTDEGCSVYWQAEGVESVRKSVRCPRALEPGERMRLTGRTCHRESARAEREVPVRCAQPLLLAEQALATGEPRELRLAPAR